MKTARELPSFVLEIKPPAGVVLAADTRATAGSTVADKNCAKLHNMAPNIYCAGAGTAADCDHVTEMIKRELELLRLNTHSTSRV